MKARSCSFDEEKLIGAAYGEGTVADRIRVFFHTRSCKECAAGFREFRRTARTFDSIEPEKCPPSVTNRVRQRIGIKKEKSILEPVLDYVFYRPAYAVSGTAVVVLLALFLTYQFTDLYDPKPDVYYTDEEIRRAQEDIEKTFAMIVPVVHDAQIQIRDNIIRSQLLPPVQHSVEKTNQLFIKGLQ